MPSAVISSTRFPDADFSMPRKSSRVEEVSGTSGFSIELRGLARARVR
jgi:hypothetical protein